MGIVIKLTYNIQDYERFWPGETEGARSRKTEERRYRLLEEVIRGIGADVIALQELPGHSQERANHGIARLAEATGMQCMARKSRGVGDPGVYAVAPGSTANLAVGLIWAKGIEPVADSWMGVREGFWHSLAALALDVGGKYPVLHASSHQPPRAGGHLRVPEARRTAQLLLEQNVTPYKMLGLDQNGTSEDRTYDPLPDLPHFTPQEIIERYVDDRAPAQAFTEGGLIDAVWWLEIGRYLAAGRYSDNRGTPLINKRAIPTTGHDIDPQYHMANYGARRIDVIRVTGGMLAALLDHDVPTYIPGIYYASDHLPQAVTYDPNRLGASY